MLIACEYLLTFFAFDRDRNDLRVKASTLDGAFSTVLRTERIPVLLFSGDLEFPRQDFSRFPHHHLRHGAEKAVAIHAIDQLLIPQTVSPTRTVKVIR